MIASGASVNAVFGPMPGFGVQCLACQVPLDGPGNSVATKSRAIRRKVFVVTGALQKLSAFIRARLRAGPTA